MATSAYQLSALTDYVKVHEDELLVKAVLDNRTVKFVDIMPNCKYKELIPTYDATLGGFQDGSACGFNPQGSDTFGEKYIETVALKAEKSWCAKDWEKKYANYQLMWEAGRITDNVPYAEFMANHNLALVQEELEDTMWNGNSGLSLTGYTELISSVESASTIEVSGLTSANTIVEIIDAVVAAIPEIALKKKVRVFLSYTNFRKYILALNSVCCANRPIIDANADELIYAGDSRVVLTPVNGIGDEFIAAATADAMVFATDVEDANNRYRLWEDETEEMLNWRVLFRAGMALRYPDEIVYWKKA